MSNSDDPMTTPRMSLLRDDECCCRAKPHDDAAYLLGQLQVKGYGKLPTEMTKTMAAQMFAEVELRSRDFALPE